MQSNSINIGGRRVGPGNPCFIIAEAGVNHNGSLDRALQMVKAASEAGADAVKFQTFKADTLVSRKARKAPYQENNSVKDETQHRMLKALELAEEAWDAILAECIKCGILFMSTPFDNDSADLLFNLGMTVFKIPSGELTNTPLVGYIAEMKRPVIMSTGMATEDEIKTAVDAVRDTGNNDLVLLQCTSSYPAEPKDVNLLAMSFLSHRFGVPAGFSDHTIGIEIPFAAVALGACVLEKHFTLDRRLPGPDHKMSLDVAGLAALTKGIRKVESALGRPSKEPVQVEKEVADAARKSIHYKRKMKNGTVLGEQDVEMLRPGDGVPPSEMCRFFGRELKKDVSAGEKLREEDFS